MDFKEYQEKTYVAIQPHTDKKDVTLNWVVGLMEEVGETTKHIKHQFWGGEPIVPDKIASELGDVLWYLSALCTSLDLNLNTIAELNKAKLEYRFGGSFSVDKSKNRHANETKFSQTDEYSEMVKRLML